MDEWLAVVGVCMFLLLCSVGLFLYYLCEAVVLGVRRAARWLNHR